MKQATKIGFIFGSSTIALALFYFLTPLKQWKKYKEEHPSLFEIKDEATPSYLAFCESYWKTFWNITSGKEDEITYNGGELPEITITPDVHKPENSQQGNEE